MPVCVGGCALQTYGIGGENLQSLTEKLRALAHTLQMGIQGRWRLNSYDGRSTTKLPTGVLQVVVELIASAKGLFSMLNRSTTPTYTILEILFYSAVFSHIKSSAGSCTSRKENRV